MGSVLQTLTGTARSDVKPFAYDPNAYKLNAGLQQNRTQAGQLLTAAQGREAPVAQAAQVGPAAQIATGPQEQTRQQQQALGGMLMESAQGRGPSLATSTIGQGVGASLAAQNAAAASARGGNVGTTMRQAGQNAAGVQLGGAIAAGQQRMQEQQAAQQALGGVLSGERAQDIGLATGQAGLQQQVLLQQTQQQQQANLANQTAQLQAMGLNDSQIRAMLGTQVGIGTQEMAGAQAYQGALAGQTNIENELAYKQQKDQNAAISALVGGGLGAGMAAATGGASALVPVAQGLTKSDETAKENIHPADKAIGEFLDKLHAHNFTYKDPADGMGEKTGVMAQELEKSKVGQGMVRQGADGDKEVDYGQGLGAMMAGLAHLHGRIRRLEGR